MTRAAGSTQARRCTALDVIDFLHFFGHGFITREEFSRVMKRGIDPDSAEQSWFRKLRRLRRYAVPHAMGVERGAHEREVSTLRLLDGAEEWALSVLPPVVMCEGVA